MHITPQSQEVLNRLSEGLGINSGVVAIGPLVGPAAHLLKVFEVDHERISGAKGEEQAQLLRKLYSKAVEKAKEDLAIKSYSKPATAPAVGWLLESLECQSIRGVAPSGVRWEFAFDGRSCLIYGPNGSGKTSMLGAVTWIFTGQVITDADDPQDEAKIFKRVEGSEKGASICSWPVVVTLPEGEMSAGSASCRATVILTSPDGSQKLYLSRTSASELTSSTDGANWSTVDDLSTFSIAPLDLQLSLLAPTMFGKRSIDAAHDSREILSLMLGFDALDELGALASTVAGNRTRLATREEKDIAVSTDALRQKLVDLADQLIEGSEHRNLLVNLASTPKPKLEEIELAGKSVKVAVTERETRLAEIIGLTVSDAGPPQGLADQLTAAVVSLEQGFPQCFPRLLALTLANAIPSDETAGSEARLTAMEEKLEAYLSNAQERILIRWKWWQRERAEGARLKLLLLAAKHFDTAAADCPVCGGSIDDQNLRNQLDSFRALDAELLLDAKAFFRTLLDELSIIVPAKVVSLGELSPQKRVEQDWTNIRDHLLGSLLAPAALVVQDAVQRIANSVDFESPTDVPLFAIDVDSDFQGAAGDFVVAVKRARMALSILRWSSVKLSTVVASLASVITDTKTEAAESSSLLDILSKGKEAAAAVKPLSNVLKGLRQAFEMRKTLDEKVANLSLLVEIEDGLEPLKQLSKYAASEVETVFGTIRAKTIANWKLLYPETSGGLTPFSLSMGKGKDRSIEPLLAKEKYIVQGQHFANAGLQRAIALSFYFALLEQHPSGLGFAILDDPILSLDEDHRESWSLHLLQPAMLRLQMVLGTHQRQYLNGCKHHFASGQIIELNSRSRLDPISWRPGDRLERAEVEVARAWTNAPTEMRKWREEVLSTLDSFSPQRIFLPGDLSGSLDRYEKLVAPHPLAGGGQRKIIPTFKSPEVTKVLDPGSHHMTEADVTEPMVRECLKKLKERQPTVQNEFKRLEDERVRSLRGGVIAAAAVDFAELDDESFWDAPIPLPLFGRAAAKSNGCVVDTVDLEESVNVSPGCAILATAETLDPIAKDGQLALLAPAEQNIADGDLVAVTTAAGHRLLRRAWSDSNKWILQSVNPVNPQPCIVIAKLEAAIHKIIGVIYDLPGNHNAIPRSGPNEWMPISSSMADVIKTLKAIAVVGNSLEPVVKTGQMVLIGEKHDGKALLKRGTLAVLETDDANVGNVIKRVFPGSRTWLLDSVNPVDPHDPLSVSTKDIRAVWPIRGVLF